MPYLLHLPSYPIPSDTDDHPTHNFYRHSYTIPHAGQVDDSVVGDIRSWGWRVDQYSEEDIEWQEVMRQHDLGTDRGHGRRGRRVVPQRMPSLLQIRDREHEANPAIAGTATEEDEYAGKEEDEENIDPKTKRADKGKGKAKLKKGKKRVKENEEEEEVPMGVMTRIRHAMPGRGRNRDKKTQEFGDHEGILVTRTFDMWSENGVDEPDADIKDIVYPIAEPSDAEPSRQTSFETYERSLKSSITDKMSSNPLSPGPGPWVVMGGI